MHIVSTISCGNRKNTSTIANVKAIFIFTNYTGWQKYIYLLTINVQVTEKVSETYYLEYI